MLAHPGRVVATGLIGATKTSGVARRKVEFSGNYHILGGLHLAMYRENLQHGRSINGIGVLDRYR